MFHCSLCQYKILLAVHTVGHSFCFINPSDFYFANPHVLENTWACIKKGPGESSLFQILEKSFSLSHHHQTGTCSMWVRCTRSAWKESKGKVCHENSLSQAYISLFNELALSSQRLKSCTYKKWTIFFKVSEMLCMHPNNRILEILEKWDWAWLQQTEFHL